MSNLNSLQSDYLNAKIGKSKIEVQILAAETLNFLTEFNLNFFQLRRILKRDILKNARKYDGEYYRSLGLKEFPRIDKLSIESTIK